jgi:hypothetical protein
VCGELLIFHRNQQFATHTYISLALTSGVSLTWLSEQTGVAVATILKHYGRFMHSSEADALELAKIGGAHVRRVLNLHSLNTGVQPRNALLRKKRNFPRKVWRPRRDLNPCYRRERTKGRKFIQHD